MTVTQQENNFSYSGNRKNTAARESQCGLTGCLTVSVHLFLPSTSVICQQPTARYRLLLAADHHTHRVRGPFAVVGELEPLRLRGLIHFLTLVILDLGAKNMEIFKTDASFFNNSLKQTVEKVC